MKPVSQFYCNFFFQLNDDTASIRKDPTLAEQNLIQANLYKNGNVTFYSITYCVLFCFVTLLDVQFLFKISDKNKSLEKETKQSYSETLSGWSQDEITDDHQYKSKKTDNEQKDRR